MKRVSDLWFGLKSTLNQSMKNQYFGGLFEGLPGQISNPAPAVGYGGKVYHRDLYREKLEAPFQIGRYQDSWENMMDEAYNAG